MPSTRPICTIGVICGDGTRVLGDFLQLAIDASGNTLIAHVHAVDDAQVKVVKQIG